VDRSRRSFIRGYFYVGASDLSKPHISELQLPASTMLLTYPLKPVFSCA